MSRLQTQNKLNEKTSVVNNKKESLDIKDPYSYYLKHISKTLKKCKMSEKIGSFEFDIWELLTIPIIAECPLLTIGMFIISTELSLPFVRNAKNTSINYENNYNEDGKDDNDTKNTNNNKPYLNLNYCANYLYQIEQTYKSNVPYHNNIHAADVVQFLFVVLQSKFVKEKFDAIDRLALLMAAAGHDAGHPGKNNDFLIKTKSQMAMKYKNESILENYHLSCINEIIKK